LDLTSGLFDKHVVMHELGHAVHLSHNNNEPSVMEAYNGHDYPIEAVDVEAYRAEWPL
jgi:predicted Zn-dependent protease